MKKNLLHLLLILFCCFSVNAQDTVVVQTFQWDDPNNFRAGVFDFPDDDPNSWEKILMLYNMRCHDLAVGSGNVGCREWDYSCNTFITDSTIVDSTRLKHPTHIISNFDNSAGFAFRYSESPVYTYYVYDQHEVTYNSTTSETTAKVGGEDVPIPFSLSKEVARQQFLFSASELVGAGFSAGDITGLKFNVTAAGAANNFLRIKIKSTDKTELNERTPDLDGFTEVYFKNTDFSTVGEHFFKFYKNFDWNGTSNLIVEFSFTNNTGADQPMIAGHQTTGLNALAYTGAANDYALRFDRTGSVHLTPNSFDAVSKEVTVNLWAKGNPGLPVNTYGFEGSDDAGNRQVSTHLPWGNGQIYWDCGNDGSGYDRINKTAAEPELKGNWVFWSFTKNAETGSMKIYKNGALWHSGTGRFKEIDLKNFVIGASKTGVTNYFGEIDGLQIWSKELDEATLKDLMHVTMNSTHPDFDHLVYDLAFNEGTGRTTAATFSGNLNGTFEGSPAWSRLRGKDLFKSFSTLNLRPALTFVSGEYDIDDQVIQVTDSIENSPNMVVSYGTAGTDLISLDTQFVWDADNSLVYNAETGDLVNFNDVTPDGEIRIGEFDYYQKRPGKFEILSLVTPYGNGLDLGPLGKTFTIDVTDYAPILRGKKRMSLEMGGQSQEDMNIRFLFIKGTPPRYVKNIQNIWPFRRGWFGQILDDTYFEPRDVALANDGAAFKIRTAITGHGQNGEFQPRTHYVNVNGGSKEFEFDVWKECSDMPIYPQGGTWTFDRAGWCPGVPTDVHELDITDMVTPGGSVEIDYGLNGLTMDQANYLVNAQLVTYGEPNFQTDAEVVEILRPTTKVEHARINPACNRPMVRIRNTGANDLTSMKIEYGETDGSKKTYDWTGNLKFLESEVIELPLADLGFWTALDGTGEFEVRLLEVNGGADEYAPNNVYVTPFERPKLIETSIEVELRTNSRGNESSYQVTDMNGNILLNRSGLAGNTRYADQLVLGRGCYTLRINDAGDDGLYYWYWEQVDPRGRGTARINGLFQNNIRITLKNFEQEFGRFISYDFSVPEYTNAPEPGKIEFFSVYPNPTSDFVNLDLKGFENEDFRVEITDVNGRVLMQKLLSVIDSDHVESIDISAFAKGMYFVKVTNGERFWTREVAKF